MVAKKSLVGELEAALSMMKDAGFEMKADVKIVVDESLPFMGYTSQKWEKHLIVVSGFAVKSGMLRGLLLHELSHVYRNVTNHPSHNPNLAADVIGSFSERNGLEKDYQYSALHQIVNHIQDLYADDIVMKVLAKNGRKLFPASVLSEFFLGWVKSSLVRSGDPQRDKWTNASIMLNNCFALSNMRRHKIRDIGGRAGERNKIFLSKVSPDAAKRFTYFNNFMVNLMENASGKVFGRQLNEYLDEFLSLVNAI